MKVMKDGKEGKERKGKEGKEGKEGSAEGGKFGGKGGGKARLREGVRRKSRGNGSLQSAVKEGSTRHNPVVIPIGLLSSHFFFT